MTAAPATRDAGAQRGSPPSYEGVEVPPYDTVGDDMGLRRHRDDHQHLRFRMREKLLSVGDDYWIEDDARNRVFKVNGKAQPSPSTPSRTITTSQPPPASAQGRLRPLVHWP